jgi:hypothetical protein
MPFVFGQSPGNEACLVRSLLDGQWRSKSHRVPPRTEPAISQMVINFEEVSVAYVPPDKFLAKKNASRKWEAFFLDLIVRQ